MNIYHLTYGETIDPETDEVADLMGSYNVLAASDLEVVQAFTRATQGLDLAYRIYMVVPFSLASFEEDLRESRS